MLDNTAGPPRSLRQTWTEHWLLEPEYYIQGMRLFS